MGTSLLRTFLCANSAEGFVSFFKDVTDSADTTVIKGGPGTGKSTLLRSFERRAREEGLRTEAVYCSSDCDSLDGLYLPDREAFCCDGTPPHTTEPVCPGAKDSLLDLTRCWDTHKLRRSRAEIVALSRAITPCYERAYGLLRAAEKARLTSRSLAAPYVQTEEFDRYQARLFGRLFAEKRDKNPRLRRRFLSAYAHRGFVTFKDTVYDAAKRVYAFDDVYGLAPRLMKNAADAALCAGYEVYAFFDPLSPGETAHVLVPELELALVTSNRTLPFEAKAAPTVRLARFVSPDVKNVRNKRGLFTHIFTDCVEGALGCIAEAKTLHDKLEAYYISAMDFSKAARVAKAAENDFFAKG